MDAHVGELRDQPVHEPSVEPPAHTLVRSLTDDDMLDGEVAGDADDRVRDLARTLDETALEQLRELP